MTDTATPTSSTLDVVDFETVRDDGVIETPETYTRLVELTPRPWLTAGEHTRDSVYTAFTQAMRGLRFPVQFLTYTSSVPVDTYLDRFDEAQSPSDLQRAMTAVRATTPDGDASDPTADDLSPGPEAPDGGVAIDMDTGQPVAAVDELAAVDEADSVDGSPILAYGRLAHARWLRQIVETGGVRDRQYFVAVGVRKDGAPPAARSVLEDLRYTIRRFLPRQGDAVDPETEQQCLAELRKRTQQAESKLTKTDVQTEICTDRATVLEVLYQYYHAEPSSITLDHTWLTRTDREPDLDAGPAADADAPPATDAPTTDAEQATSDDDGVAQPAEPGASTTSTGGDGDGDA